VGMEAPKKKKIKREKRHQIEKAGGGKKELGRKNNWGKMLFRTPYTSSKKG